MIPTTQPTDRKTYKTMLKTVLVIAFTLVIFYILFSKIDIYSVSDVLQHSNLWSLSIAFFLLVPYLCISAQRWKVILRSLDYRISFIESVSIILATLPLTSVTPSKSGDVIKGFYLKDRIPLTKTVGSVITERALDIFFLILLCLIGLLFYPSLRIFVVIFAMLVLLIIFFVVSYKGIALPVKKSWNDKLQNLFLSTKILAKDARLLAQVMILTALLWIIAIVQTLAIFQAVGADVPFLFAVANVPIAIFMGQLPITLGGMGTRDSAIIVLFSDYANTPELLAAGILFSFVRYWSLSVVGIPAMHHYLRRHR